MKITVLFTWIVLSAITLQAQHADVENVTRAAEDLRKAMIESDQASLEKLTSEKLSYEHSSGLVEDKVTFIGALTSGKADFISIDITDQTISIIDNIAIVRHKLNGQVKVLGAEPVAIALHVLQVWQKTKKGWVLLARHASKQV
jgi:hypothetical protein